MCIKRYLEECLIIDITLKYQRTIITVVCFLFQPDLTSTWLNLHAGSFFEQLFGLYGFWKSLLILIISLYYPFWFCMNMMTLIVLNLFVMQSSLSSKLKTEASIIAITKDDSFSSTNSFVLLKNRDISITCSLWRWSHECKQKICRRNEHWHEQWWQGNVAWQFFAVVVLILWISMCKPTLFSACVAIIWKYLIFFFFRKNPIVDGLQKICIECSLFIACEWSVKIRGGDSAPQKNESLFSLYWDYWLLFDLFNQLFRHS